MPLAIKDTLRLLRVTTFKDLPHNIPSLPEALKLARAFSAPPRYLGGGPGIPAVRPPNFNGYLLAPTYTDQFLGRFEDTVLHPVKQVRQRAYKHPENLARHGLSFYSSLLVGRRQYGVLLSGKHETHRTLYISFALKKSNFAVWCTLPLPS